MELRGPALHPYLVLPPQPPYLCVLDHGQTATKHSVPWFVPWLLPFSSESYERTYLESVDTENANEKAMTTHCRTGALTEASWSGTLNPGISNSYSVSLISTKTIFQETLLHLVHPHPQSHPLPYRYYCSTVGQGYGIQILVATLQKKIAKEGI